MKLDWFKVFVIGLLIIIFIAIFSFGIVLLNKDSENSLDAKFTNIAAAGAGKNVYLPPATYRIGATGGDLIGLYLPSNLTMQGAGDTSIIYTTTARYPLWIEGKTHLTLRDFAVDSNNSVSGQALIFIKGNNSYITFDGLKLSDSHWTGIQSQDNSSTITHSDFLNLDIDNIGEWGIGIMGGGSYLTFTDCDVHNTGFNRALYDNDPPHGFYLKSSNNITMLRCTASTIAINSQHNSSAFTINDVSDSTFTDCDGSSACYGIAVNHYPSTGCNNLDFFHCGGSNNEQVDRFDYGTNYDIYWDATCYGTYSNQ